MDPILLNNRYGDRNKLIPIDDNKFQLDCENKSYLRIGLADGYKWEDGEYHFVDPSGGPFISVGSEWDFGRITRIYEQDKQIIIEYERTVSN